MDKLIDLNGNQWSEPETRLYHQYTKEIEATKNPDTREYLLSNRHKFYVFTAEIYRLEKEVKQ